MQHVLDWHPVDNVRFATVRAVRGPRLGLSFGLDLLHSSMHGLSNSHGKVRVPAHDILERWMDHSADTDFRVIEGKLYQVFADVWHSDDILVGDIDGLGKDICFIVGGREVGLKLHECDFSESLCSINLQRNFEIHVSSKHTIMSYLSAMTAILTWNADGL